MSRIHCATGPNLSLKKWERRFFSARLSVDPVKDSRCSHQGSSSSKRSESSSMRSGEAGYSFHAAFFLP
ncbi:unnamed protein product [Caenorhabditis nigoni]